LPQCACHGLRKIGAVRAAEAGASEHELMAMSGWENAGMPRAYTRKAVQRNMRRAALPSSFRVDSLSPRLSHQQKRSIRTVP
jgi:hypothetical protein